MKWGRYWRESVLAAFVVALKWLWDTQASAPLKGVGWTAQRKLAAREKTRELWYHGFNNYITHAFPLDELTPLSCSGQGPDWVNAQNVATNDVAGNFSLTLIDVLDTLVVLDDRHGFEEAVRNVIDWVSFDVDTKPQVFETTIRVLGGLLSGHIFANKTGQPFYLPWYKGELLDMAHDLGKRLLPAFATPTGLPYARINLRRGLVRGETMETCTAGAGSLILEFATLSRLTGDDRFEKVAYKAFFGIWNRRSDIGLVGNTINTWSGAWTHPEITGIGAGIDSFYEYALKWYVMSGEVEFLDVWDDAYAAIMRYSRATDGFWYRTVNMNSGDVAFFTIDSLSAFWPGLQVLAGDVQSAIRLHLLYYNLWRQHSGLPEVFDTNYKQATSHQYPLRPEFIESTWYLYRATKDPFYLDVGERVLFDLITRAKVDCGLTGIQDLRTNKRDDRMESFALSETLKYLFLIFDEDNPLHNDDSNYVFTTEGHILTLGADHLKPISPSRRRLRSIENHQCPAYRPFILAYDNPDRSTGLVQGIQSRGDVDYARLLVGLPPSQNDIDTWSPNGWCEKPHVDFFSYDFVLSPNGKSVPEDLSPSLLKLGILPDGYVIHNVTGIRTHIVRRLDGKGYDIRKLGHYAVRPGHIVYINDSSLSLERDGKSETALREPDIQLRFYMDAVDPLFQIQTGALGTVDSSNEMHALITGYTGRFGSDLNASSQSRKRTLRFSRGEGVAVHRDVDNSRGCGTYTQLHTDSLIVVHRGDCTFLEKLLQAQSASAAGILVISDDDSAVNPTANAGELDAAGDLTDIAIVLLPRKAGRVLTEMMDRAEQRDIDRVMVALDHGPQPINTDTNHIPQRKLTDSSRILYLNGHPLLNTRLLI